MKRASTSPKASFLCVFRIAKRKKREKPRLRLIGFSLFIFTLFYLPFFSAEIKYRPAIQDGIFLFVVLPYLTNAPCVFRGYLQYFCKEVIQMNEFLELTLLVIQIIYYITLIVKG